ncbi:hypothetical protein D3C73_1662260 [compost metagenome]
MADFFPEVADCAGSAAAEGVHAGDFLDGDSGDLCYYAVGNGGGAASVLALVG